MRKHWFLLLVVIFFVAMVGLGFWQLHRYRCKQVLLEQYHHNSRKAPLLWRDFLLKKDRLFYRVRINGQYLNSKTLLLENRWHRGQLGYQVLTPFRIDGEEKALLVKRGWVRAAANHRQLPFIEPIIGERSLVAYVRLPPDSGFMLGDNIPPGQSWPMRIQQIDLDTISKATGLPFYPYVLQLIMLHDWQLFNVMPARHLAYAVQWFVMAIVLVIAYSIFLIRSRK